LSVAAVPLLCAIGVGCPPGLELRACSRLAHKTTDTSKNSMGRLPEGEREP
jgi:hypothetical protein